MVHNLRARNVCGTSGTTKSPKRGVLNSSEIATDATPLTVLNDFNMGFHAENIMHSTILPVKLGRHFESSVLTQKERTPPTVGHHSSALSSIMPLLNTERSNCWSTSSYESNIQAAIDQIIFQNTHKKLGGISTYAIKKSLGEDYNYKSIKFRKIVPKYISNSISTGKLRQITGRGANGTFRLSQKVQKDVGVGNNRYRHVSSRSVIIKRFKRNLQIISS